MPLLCNLGTLTSWNPLIHSRPVTGLLYLFFYLILMFRFRSKWEQNSRNLTSFRVLNALVDPYIAGFSGALGLLSPRTSSLCGLNYWERCSNKQATGVTELLHIWPGFLDPEDGGNIFLWNFGDWNVIVFSCHSNPLTWNSIVTTLCPVFFSRPRYLEEKRPGKLNNRCWWNPMYCYRPLKEAVMA
jgi:hypothetical protein